MNLREGTLAKTQADLVSADNPPANVVSEEQLTDLPGLEQIFELSSEERKAMFISALRSRRGVTRFTFRLGNYDKTKTEKVTLPGLENLHAKSYEDIASILLATTQLKDDFVGFAYSIQEDRNGKVTNKLEVEFGVKINPANCQVDEEGNRKDKKFGPFFAVEYTTI